MLLRFVISTKTYLSQNTHRHVVCAVIAPPKIGPRIEEQAEAAPTEAETWLKYTIGVISRIDANAKE
jgi:hypothetical protein